MDRDTLKQKLLSMLNEHMGLEFPNLQESDELRAGLGLDSVDLVTMLIEIQSQLGVRISTEEAGQITTVGQLLDQLQAKLPVQAAA